MNIVTLVSADPHHSGLCRRGSRAYPLVASKPLTGDPLTAVSQGWVRHRSRRPHPPDNIRGEPVELWLRYRQKREKVCHGKLAARLRDVVGARPRCRSTLRRRSDAGHRRRPSDGCDQCRRQQSDSRRVGIAVDGAADAGADAARSTATCGPAARRPPPSTPSTTPCPTTGSMTPRASPPGVIDQPTGCSRWMRH